jgi:hypothetical protein
MADTKAVNQARSAISGQVVTQTTTFSELTRAIYIGNSGNIGIQFADGVSVTITNAAAGYHPLQVEVIKGDNLTASNIVALF